MKRCQLLLLPLVLSGCAGMHPQLGFDQVQRSVAERTGMQTHWDSGSPEDLEARQALRSLLDNELGAGEAVQIALLNNRDLQALYEDLSLAQADLVRAGLLRNPIFSGEVRWSTVGHGTGIVLDLSEDFVSLLTMPLRRGRADAEFEAAKLRVTGAALDLAGEVRSVFYELQGAQQLLEMRRTVAEATEASYDLAKRLRAAGNNRDLDVANERALRAQSKLDLSSAEAVVSRERERLNELMGLWGGDTTWRVATRLPAIPQDEPPAEDLERRAVERSLDLAIARRGVEVAARTLGIARPFGTLTETEVGVAAERETDGQWSVGPSLSAPVPLFDQGNATIGSAQAQVRQAQNRYAATAVRVRARVRAAYSDAVAARDRTMYQERVLLPLRQQIVDETQLLYNAMQVSAFQLLQARRDQIEAGARYVESLRDYWVARSRLDQILSGRLPPGGAAAEAGASATSLAAGGEGGHR